MSGFRPYPAYKDSGVEWLREVPEHWEVFPLKRDLVFLTSGSRGWAELYSETGALFLRIGNLRRNSLALDLSEIQRVEVPKGVEGERTKVLADDVLFSITAYLGSVAVVPSGIEVAYVSQHVALARIGRKFLLSRWVGYVSLSWVGKTYLESQGYGGTKVQLSLDDIANMVMTAPRLAEQQMIASFLDHETARIDALIAEQQRLIELLKEKRQAVISHAVTKGLDPTVPMKDSGVEWLGEVPEHWVVSKLKFMTDCVVDCPHETPNYNPDGDYLVIRTADLDQGLLKPEQMYRLDRDEYVHRTRRASLKRNDVVYGREGERWGHAALVPESDLYALGQRMMQFRVAAHVCPEYFMFQLNSIAVYRQGEVDTVGATSPHVNISTIINYQMMVPPQEEQSRISMYLNKILRDLDSLINESADAMGLLQERRSALISAAVTGKIDVRGWQPPASSQAPEPAVAEAV